MQISRRLGLALLACTLVATSACGRAPPSETSAEPAAVAADAAAPSPDQIVRTRAPRDEITLLIGKSDFSKTVSAPNAGLKRQAQAKKAAEWKSIVLGVGQFQDWVGYTKAIYISGRIEVSLSDGIILFADVPKNSRLRGVVDALREDSQLVLISGKISQSFLEAAKISADTNSPTCFENHFGQNGCQIDLTNISPLP